MNTDLPKKKSRISVTQRIVDSICKSILDGSFKPGTKIPTEIELCQLFDASRNSVREAIKILQAYGLLEIRTSEGTFVSDGRQEIMINPLIYGTILGSDNNEHDMIEFQIMFDKAISKMCADKCTDEDKEKLTEAYNKLLAAIYPSGPLDIEEVIRTDYDFHTTIAQATHNSYVIIIHNSIWELLKAVINNDIRITMENNREHMRILHENIYDGIMKNDPQLASDAIPVDYFINLNKKEY
jgi:DNA-binding FadR family transcriptional regulator